MCILGPQEIKEDIYNVMTNSRELTNYCQESVRPVQSNKLSDALNHLHLDKAVQFITELIINQDQAFIESKDISFENQINKIKQPIYNRVMKYIQDYLIK